MRINKLSLLLWVIGVGGLIALVTVAIINRNFIYDYYRGMTYTPEGEMARIRDDLKLTNEGQFVFNSTQPKLSESEEFNKICRPNEEVEIAVLGCYTGGDIYVYNITDKELNGIRELTSAHELLHAVWAKMSEEERTSLNEALQGVLKKDGGELEKELAVYDDKERQEELYVRAGTEIAHLPDTLEKHYARFFENQDLIVGFYNSYIKVFREIETEMDALRSEMETIKTEIDAKKMEYENRVKQLTADVASFNGCAGEVGCFASEAEFYAQRGVLVAEQEALDLLYDEINRLIDEYNTRIDKYNEDVRQGEKLEQLINSSSKVKELE